VTGRRGRRRKELLDNLKERRGYFHLKEEALDRTMWRGRFGRGFGPVAGQTTKLVNSHQHVSATITAVFRVMPLLQEHKRTLARVYLTFYARSVRHSSTITRDGTKPKHQVPYTRDC
jgi:hypothetical protein